MALKARGDITRNPKQVRGPKIGHVIVSVKKTQVFNMFIKRAIFRFTLLDLFLTAFGRFSKNVDYIQLYYLPKIRDNEFYISIYHKISFKI